MEIAQQEKDKTAAFAKAIAIALLSITLVHFGAFLVWVGSSNEKFRQLAENDVYHTTSIRELQKNDK